MSSHRRRTPGSHRLRPGRLAAAFVGLALAVAGTGPPANADDTTTPAPPVSSTQAAAPAGRDVVVVDLHDASEVAAWTTINDPVMGGLSTSEVTFGGGGLTFSGSISLENNGGFASARGPVNPDIGRKAAGAKSFRVVALGDGKTYVLKLGTAGQPWSYIQRFRTEAGVVRSYELPLEGFQPVGMRMDPAPGAPQTLDPSAISQVSVYILDKQQGPFELTLGAIEAAS